MIDEWRIAVEIWSGRAPGLVLRDDALASVRTLRSTEEGEVDDGELRGLRVSIHERPAKMSAPFDPVTEFPRLGYLWENGEPDRPEVPALLHFSQERGLYVEVPFTSGSHEGAGRWFGRNPQECPERLLFQDHELDLHLFGVHVASQGRDPRYEPGLGGLRTEFAVEDRDRSDVEYADVAAVRSEIDGLHEFMGWRLTEMDFSSPPETPDRSCATPRGPLSTSGRSMGSRSAWLRPIGQDRTGRTSAPSERPPCCAPRPRPRVPSRTTCGSTRLSATCWQLSVGGRSTSTA